MLVLINADNDIEIKYTLDELKETDPELYEKVVNLDDYFEISLSESEDLTNGDTINLVLHTSDQVDFIKDDEKEITVAGLEELEELTSEEVKEHVICETIDRKSTRLNSSHVATSYAVCCPKKNKRGNVRTPV